MVFGVFTYNSDVMPPFTFLHSFRLNTEANIEHERGSAGLDREGNCWKILLCHAIQAGVTSVAREKNSVTSHLTSDRLSKLQPPSPTEKGGVGDVYSFFFIPLPTIRT